MKKEKICRKWQERIANTFVVVTLLDVGNALLHQVQELFICSIRYDNDR